MGNWFVYSLPTAPPIQNWLDSIILIKEVKIRTELECLVEPPKISDTSLPLPWIRTSGHVAKNNTITRTAPAWRTQRPWISTYGKKFLNRERRSLPAYIPQSIYADLWGIEKQMLSYGARESVISPHRIQLGHRCNVCWEQEQCLGKAIKNF